MATNLGNYSIGYEVDEASLKKTYNQIVSEIEKTGKVSQDTLNKMISSGTQSGVQAAKQYVAELKTKLIELQEIGKDVKYSGNTEEIKKNIQAVDDLKAKIKSAEGTVKELESQSDTSGNKMVNIFKKIGTYVASAFAVQKIVQFGKKLVEWSDNATAAEKSFETMFGSAEKAHNMMKQLDKFSVASYTDVETVRENTKQLYAMGIEYEKLIPTMTSLGNVAAGLNIPLERLALNYGQVKTQGKLSGTDLRDFLKAGVPLTEELAKNMGVSAEEIKKMVSEGKVGFADVEKAFETMTSEGGKFYGMMESKGSTVSGQIEKLSNQFQILATNIAQEVVPGLTMMVERANKLFNRGQDKTDLEIAIESTNEEIKDLQWVVSDSEKKIADLKEQFRTGKITADEFTEGYQRLAGMINVANHDIEELNKKQERNTSLNETATDVVERHTARIEELTEENINLRNELEDLHDQLNAGAISEEEYAELSKQLTDKMKENAVATQQENDFFNKQKMLLDLLAESGADYNTIKDIMASLQLDTNGDIVQLVNEAGAVNNATNAYIKYYEIKSELDLLEKQKTTTGVGKFFKNVGGWFKTGLRGEADRQNNYIDNEIGIKKAQMKQAMNEYKQEGDKIIESLKDENGKIVAAANGENVSTSTSSGNTNTTTSGGGGGGGTSNKVSNSMKQTEQEVKNLEKAYKDMDSSLDKANKAAEKYNDAQQKFWKETNDDIKKIDDSLAKLKDNYEKTIQSINDALNEKNSNDVSSYVKDQYTKMRDLQKEISNMERGRDDDGNSVDYDGSKISKYRSQIEEIKRNLDEVGEISGLGDSGIDAIISKVKERYDLETEEAKKLYDLKEQLRKNEEEALAKKEEELKKYEEEKKALERKKLITQAMQQANIKNEAELDEFKKKIAYDQFSLEEQQIIDKYAQEKIELFNKKMDAIAAAEEYYQKEQELMNQNHVVAMSNVKSLSAEYSKLLSQLSTAISRQRTLNALRSSGGYAEGGYTGNGNPYDVAGVVHKGEWVMPNWMVKSMQGTVSGLEAIRTGNSSVVNNNTSKHQTNNITVNSRFDIEGFLGKANWKF